MSHNRTAQKQDADVREPRGAWRRAPRLTRFKKAMLAVACVLMAVGLGRQGLKALRGGPMGGAVASAPEKATPVAGHSAKESAETSSLTEHSAPATKRTNGTAGLTSLASAEDWSPATFRLGFSFFAGFCIAYAARAFFKIAVIATGVILITLFVLQYSGVAGIDLATVKEYYDAVADRLGAQMSDVQRFVTGHLPSSGAAALGLGMGFKKS